MNDSKLNICFKGIHSWGRHVSLILYGIQMEMICCVFKKNDKEKHELATEHLIGTTISLQEKGIQRAIQWLNYVNMVLINVYIAR